MSTVSVSTVSVVRKASVATRTVANVIGQLGTVRLRVSVSAAASFMMFYSPTSPLGPLFVPHATRILRFMYQYFSLPFYNSQQSDLQRSLWYLAKGQSLFAMQVSLSDIPLFDISPPVLLIV